MPLRFNSHETGEAFTECCDCGCELRDASMHIVNQSYVGEECVFEFAMCLECREKMNEQLSEKSRVAMFDFIHDNADMEAREKELGADSGTDAYLANCVTCGRLRSESASYTLSAIFTGDHLLKGPFPMFVCGNCEEKISESISDETRDFWDNFIAEHFPGPPSELILPTGTKPVFI